MTGGTPMAILNNHFQRFHSNISLDPTRQETIKSAHTTLRDFVASDGPLSKVLHESFLQGSFRTNTAIRPAEGQEFDVDVVLSIDAIDPNSILRCKRNPTDVVAWVADRLRTNSLYEGKVRQRTRCVRLIYAGDFHLDIIPAHCDGNIEDSLEIPDRDADSWMKTHPKGYIQWCNQQNKRTNGYFTRVTKMVKWWRDLKFASDRAPKSIVLQTLIGQHMPASASSDAEALVHTLVNLHKWLQSQWCDFLAPPTISNPSLPNENLTRDWDLDDYKLFKGRVESAANKACQAYQEEDVEKGVRFWRELFGDAFPVST
jgi:hypothetical protein